jgi:tyrosyl-tRNA synthetase
MSHMDLITEFEWRGMLYDATEGLPEMLAKEKVTGYIGFDPSAASLHVGSLLPIMGLVHLQRNGHIPIAVVGGGTGLIGDPSGKTQERRLLSREEVDTNIAGIKQQLSRFLDFDNKTNPAIMVNNADWLDSISVLDFFRDVGKHFSVNYMVAKESIKRRLEQEEGISFTEFSYLLLQSYDFLVLHDRYNCTLQMGGSDQWGNITAGIDLIRRFSGDRAYGLVFPLLATSSGVKFGKTEAGTVWLDSGLTSPYRFYQFWFNTDDRDVITYMKFFTLLSQEEIQGYEEAVAARPEKREAQKKLAGEITRLVHGDTALEKAEKASRVLFGEEISQLSVEDITDIFADVPSSEIKKSQFSGDGTPFVDITVSAGLASSKGEARRLIQGGGLYLNNVRVSDVQRSISLSDSIGGQVFIIRKGAKQYHLVRLTQD